MVRHQPEGLEQLQAQTQFTRKELQSLYRGFKNVWKLHENNVNCLGVPFAEIICVVIIEMVFLYISHKR